MRGREQGCVISLLDVGILLLSWEGITLSVHGSLKSSGVNPSCLGSTTFWLLAGAWSGMQHLCRALLKFLINEFQRQPSICGTFHKICHTERINFLSWALQWPEKLKNQIFLFGWWKRQESLYQTLMDFGLNCCCWPPVCHVSSGWLEILKHWGVISGQSVPQFPLWKYIAFKMNDGFEFPMM